MKKIISLTVHFADKHMIKIPGKYIGCLQFEDPGFCFEKQNSDYMVEKRRKTKVAFQVFHEAAEMENKKRKVKNKNILETLLLKHNIIGLNITCCDMDTPYDEKTKKNRQECKKIEVDFQGEDVNLNQSNYSAKNGDVFIVIDQNANVFQYFHKDLEGELYAE